MGTLVTILEAIEARLVVLEFKQTELVFSFEDVPKSIINKAFRIETELLEGRYYSGNVSNPLENVIIWIAYKARRKPRTVQKTAMNDVETIETDIINAASITGLASDPLLTLDRDASMAEPVAGYIVSKIAFTINYIRDVSP